MCLFQTLFSCVLEVLGTTRPELPSAHVPKTSYGAGPSPHAWNSVWVRKSPFMFNKWDDKVSLSKQPEWTDTVSNLHIYDQLTVCVSVAQSCPTLCKPMDCSLPGSSVHEIFQAKDTGVGCHFLLQRIFPTQGLNPVSCTEGRFFTDWATREAPQIV